MTNLGEDIMRPGLFVRYNPDGFKTDGRKQNPNWSTRMDVLRRWLKHASDFNNLPHTLQMVRLFFDDYSVESCSVVTLRERSE